MRTIGARLRAAALAKRVADRLSRALCVVAAALYAGLPGTPASARDTAPRAFRTEIKAPGALERALEEGLDLVRWERYDAVSDQLLETLLEQARVQASEILSTRGYFSARVTAEVVRDNETRVVHMVVDPGEPTKVRHVQLALAEGAAANKFAQARLAAVHKSWPLRAGDVFTQAGWEAAKRHGMETLARERYAAASIVASKAKIDPEAHAADLEVTFEPGPEFMFGPLEVVGLQRYSEQTVRNLSPLAAGDPYSREKLETYEQRLIATNYFASVQVTVAPRPEQSAALPVRVSVIESPSHKIDVGLGYSTDTRWRVQVDYRDVNFLDTQHRLTSTLRYESLIQTASVTLDAPPQGDGWLNSYTGTIEAKQIEGLETVATHVNALRRKIDERNQPALGLGYILERQEPAGLSPDTTYALIGTYGYTWRRTDDLRSPRTGWNAEIELGAAPPGISSRTFGRVLAKWNSFYPLARHADASLRAEAGAVLAPTANGIPQAVLFRTGGDTTVRGYAFESLGVPQGDAIVGARYYGLASGETIYWAAETLGIAAFLDAGNAWDERSDARLRLGYGLGARIRTPAGPFRLDVAYGHDVHQFRVHFSFGLTF